MSSLPPAHQGRTTNEIVTEKLYFDSPGYLYRAMSWLDAASCERIYPHLLYACIEGRMGIEYLLFEQVVISTGAKLTEEQYLQCVRDGKLEKSLLRITPEYEKLQQFTRALASVEPSLPKLVEWEPKELMKAWGQLSEHLHWQGVRGRTTECPEWAVRSLQAVRTVLEPIWTKLSSGQSGIMHPSEMKSEVHEVWKRYLSNEIDLESVKFQLDYLRPTLMTKYGA
jgi:hypothetical protein